MYVLHMVPVLVGHYIAQARRFTVAKQYQSSLICVVLTLILFWLNNNYLFVDRLPVFGQIITHIRQYYNVYMYNDER